MSHFTFVIPLNRDDLFEAPTRNQYTVENVYNTRDIKIKLSVSFWHKAYFKNDQFEIFIIYRIVLLESNSKELNICLEKGLMSFSL